MTFCLEPYLQVRRDGEKLFIININTGWESQRFGLEEIRVHPAGLLGDITSRAFDLKVVVK